MTNEEAIDINKRYANVYLTEEEKDVIYDCWMNGVNRDGHVWVTWTDVERIVCALKGENE